MSEKEGKISAQALYFEVLSSMAWSAWKLEEESRLK